MLRVTINVNSDISLQQLKEQDALVIFALVEANRTHLGAFLPWVASTLTVADSLNFIKERQYNSLFDVQFPLKVVFKGEMVGMCGFNMGNESENYVETGYWIDQAFSGKGIITQCVAAQIAYLKSETNIAMLRIRCHPANTKSAAIPIRLAFEEKEMLDGHRNFELKLK